MAVIKRLSIVTGVGHPDTTLSAFSSLFVLSMSSLAY